jgi:8-oxo-dGTP diphosphatase
MQEYVTGFLFTSDKRHVVLIRKNKPEWQKGCWNGVGGKIEAGEMPLEAMIREFKEETDMDVSEWKEFAVLESSDFKVYFFSSNAILPEVHTVTDERVDVIALSMLEENRIPHIQNLKWLIPMCLDNNHKHAVIQQ